VYDAAIGSFDRILWEDEHINRLLSNAKRIGINHPYNKKMLSAILREIAIKSMNEVYFIYIQISQSSSSRTHSAANCKSNLLITVDPFENHADKKPLSLMSFPDHRYGYCDIKTTNLLPAVLSATEAEKKGYDEAVFIKNGYVTECTKSNISIINQGRIITHPKNNEILPGLAREHLLRICQREAIPFEERKFTYDELLNADEILVTSTTKLCKDVAIIDGRAVGGNNLELKKRLMSAMVDEFNEFCLQR
jgi:D-alanine transaminase